MLYNTLSSIDYCHLLCYLQELATEYSEDLYDLVFFSDNNGYLKSNIIAAWIMFDWPTNLITFLNILNCLDIKYINRSSFEVDNEWWGHRDVIEDRFMRIFNPLGCLKLYRIKNLFNSYKEIYQPLMNYYYENSNKENVKMKMNKYIYLNDYVEFDIAIKIFFDPHNYYSDITEFVKDYFHIYNFFNKEYLGLEEIFDFYSKIIKNCSVLFSDIEEIQYTYSDYQYFFRFFHISLIDIIRIVLCKKITVRINPVHFDGLRYIYFKSNQTLKELLILLANRIDDTD